MRALCLYGSIEEKSIYVINLTFGLSEVRVLLLELMVQAIPLFVQVLTVVLVLSHCELLFLLCVHPEGLFKCEWIDLLQDGLEGNQ